MRRVAFARPRSAPLAHFDDLLIEDDLGLLKFNLQRPWGSSGVPTKGFLARACFTNDAAFISKTAILHRLMSRNVMAVTVIGLQITYFLGRSTKPSSAGRMDAKTGVDRCRGN
jgi:hypothetical protein